MRPKTSCLQRTIAAIPMLVAAIALVAMGTPASAQDLAGTRDVPTSGKLKKKDVEKYGFRVKWVADGDAGVEGAISSAVAEKGNAVMAADTSGFMYAFDKNDGTVLWKTCIDPHGAADDCSTSGGLGAGILGNPVVSGNMVYQGTLSGNMVAVDIASGAIVWTEEAGINAPQEGSPVDSIWGGAIVVQDKVIFGTSPADQFGPLPNGEYARGGLVALNKHTGARVWLTHTVTLAEFADGASGAGTWHSHPTYSPELGLVFIGTGQDRNPGNSFPPDFEPDPFDSSAGSDSLFAFRVSDGSVAWQTQFRDTDSWNTGIPFNPLTPIDTDVSNSPSVFRHRGGTYVAAGDKRGIFWVLDAATGTIVNNGGLGLDMFGTPPGVPMDSNLPGPGLRGGFNLDSGYFKKGGQVYHFGTYADLGQGFIDAGMIVDSDEWIALGGLAGPFPEGECDVAAGPSRPGCPEDPIGNLVIMDAMGENVMCRFVTPGVEQFTALHVDGMILTRGAASNRLYAVDAANCRLIDSIVTPVASLGLGASISIEDGVVYSGGGFFSQFVGGVGLAAIEVDMPAPGRGRR